ncbi:hypothetical protein DPMN_155767 [Dreissena polymorpha]|uniref:Uncharacterized protein n=1 Tax=Dreissena polymorpha TaxID=45954 RepID=A0A9D4JB80_DREPO|nr:hypothetical protein DPMN_155767 [Dreissena polymorpha]
MASQFSVARGDTALVALGVLIIVVCHEHRWSDRGKEGWSCSTSCCSGGDAGYQPAHTRQ